MPDPARRAEERTEPMVRPFSSGSEFSFWTHRNCHNCRRFNRAEWNPGDCDIDHALGLAYMGHGEVPESIAKRAGLPVPYPHGDGICPELEVRHDVE